MFNKLVSLVLFYESLYDLFYKILNDLTSDRDISIGQAIYIVQKSIFLSTIETLTIVWVRFFTRVRLASISSRQRRRMDIKGPRCFYVIQHRLTI